MKNMMLKMPRTESPKVRGLNDAGIETYKNIPMKSLTKEEIQNATDAAIDTPDGSVARVEVEFDAFDLPVSNIPDVERLKRVYEDELTFWTGFLQNDKRPLDFFKNCIKLLGKDKIRILRISDYKTTGLTGIHGVSTPWKNLVVNTEVSDKPGGAGGSFGIGKNAAFACSQLRLVMYSTRNIEGEEATQGTLLLPSYQKGNEKFDGSGFVCLSSEDINIDPLLKSVSMDEGYERSETGLDKYILGFDEEKTAEELKMAVIKSAIENFLYAFYQNTLEVRYDDIIINQENLADFIEKYGEKLEDITKEQYMTLTKPDKVENFSIFEENDVTYFIRLDPEATKKAAVVRRSGMKVFDRSYRTGRIGFSAVIVLNNPKINEFFKSLENPEHSDWSAERAKDEAEAKSKMDLLFSTLREKVKEMHQDDFDESVDADGLNEYLPYTYVAPAKKNRVESLSNEVKEKKKKAKKRRQSPKLDTEEIRYTEDEFGNIDENTIEIVDENGSAGGSGDGHNNGSGHGNRDGRGGEGNEDGTNAHEINAEGSEERTFSVKEDGEFIARRQVASNNFSFALEQKEGEYLLRLMSSKKVNSGFVEVVISGEQQVLVSNILAASVDGKPAKYKKNKIAFESMSADEIHNIKFTLKNKGNWALEVMIYEN